VKTSEVNDNDQPDLNEAFFMDRERAPDDPECWPANCSANRTNGRGPAGFRAFLLR